MRKDLWIRPSDAPERRGKKYNTPFKEVTVSIFKGAPKTDCSRHDKIVHTVQELNPAIACIHFQDQRYSEQLLELLRIEFPAVHGGKV